MKRLCFSFSLYAIFAILLVASMFPTSATAQATFTAQVRGVVQDTSKAVVPRATVTITNDGTQVPEKTTTDDLGRYIFNGLAPASYTVKVEVSGFKTVVRSNVVLRVGQQIDLDFTLELGEITSTVEVTAESTLLNSVSGALGTEVTNRYIIDMPLAGRGITELAYLAPGTTEVPGMGISMLGGTTFTSNGQRYGTAEFRADGALTSSPEGGEGGNTTVKYQPLIENVQEFKLQNNNFSAEFGNNGGTVVNIVTKSGTNEFHGSGWYFFQRPQFDANSFFANRDGESKGDYVHDQYGASVGGPIIKRKTFFFTDFEKTRDRSPNLKVSTVPTDLQKAGDFSQTFNADGTLQQIFNPNLGHYDANGNWIREPFSGNRIPPELLDPVAIKIMNLYPAPTQAGDPITGRNNFTKNVIGSSPGYHYDFKIDHVFTDKSRAFVRYGIIHYLDDQPAGSSVIQGSTTDRTNIHNAVISYDWTPSPSILWTSRLGVDRFHEQRILQDFDAGSVGLPPILGENSGLKRLPAFEFDGYQSIVGSSCADTVEAHTQWMYSSSLSKVIRGHNLKFGGEQRQFLNNFWQPCDPNGAFFFGRGETVQDPFNPNNSQGNAIASLLAGWPNDASMGTTPPTSNKSKDTGFFIQDDWKLTKRLTLNIGLRYEWSTPYTERFNRLSWSDFSGDSGIDVPGLGRIHGVNRLADSEQRTISSDRNNFGPRLGFAFRLNEKTVLRGGGGVYYGFNPHTNFQYVSPAWVRPVNFVFSKDGGVSRFATLSNPLPNGLGPPPGPKYGLLDRWGFSNSNNLSDTFRNAEIYQWSLGIQRELPGNVLIDVNYSANHSTHLPDNDDLARNKNFVSREDREKWGSRGLNEQIPNPFQYLFQGPDAIFNEPTSLYNDPTLRRQLLLRPFPQFSGSFRGSPAFDAIVNYHSLQVRFEKRYSYGLNFTGQYTFSKLIDTSSEGLNAWIGDIWAGQTQDPTNRKAEKSVGSSDTPQRLAFAVSYDLPVGRAKRFGNNMNRVADAIVGGWKINSFVTFQSGNPISVSMGDFSRLANGRQRPNVSGDPRGVDIKAVVDGRGDPKFNFFNVSAFSDPGDQIPGNAPRYFSKLRTDGINNMNTSIFKSFTFREGMYLQLRAEFFNFTNTPRFGRPGEAFGSDEFGKINSQINSPRSGQMGLRFVF
ncbi:MAG: hypothetical protein DMG08_27210 [Acidobacteria bacterium]|nr:MAG: hypothetical protein DMG08_27210 [Acidobacteriota bacterium]